MVNLADPDGARAEAYLSSEADLRRTVVSPDGTLAAYTSDESGQYEIYIRSFPEPGAQTVVSQGGGDVPFWSPDGNTLYYARRSIGGATFMAAPHRARSNAGGGIQGFVVRRILPPPLPRLRSPSGRRPAGLSRRISSPLTKVLPSHSDSSWSPTGSRSFASGWELKAQIPWLRVFWQGGSP